MSIQGYKHTQRDITVSSGKMITWKRPVCGSSNDKQHQRVRRTNNNCTTTVHAVATRTAAFKTVQCNELNVTMLYILITKQINKAYKYYLWWQTKQVYIHLHQFLYRFHFLMRHIVDSNKRWSIRVTKCILELSQSMYGLYTSNTNTSFSHLDQCIRIS